MLKEVKAAQKAVAAYKSAGELERSQVEFVGALLTDAVTRLELLPRMLETAGKAQAVHDAERALEAAQTAQRG